MLFLDYMSCFGGCARIVQAWNSESKEVRSLMKKDTLLVKLGRSVCDVISSCMRRHGDQSECGSVEKSQSHRHVLSS
jgi:hypothetical protein